MDNKTNSWFMPITTAVAVVVAIGLAFIGSGALGGTAVSDAAGGALSADATPLAPASTAFSIWSVIYVGLAVYAVYQLLPAQRDSKRHARLRPWAALSALLNAGWLAVVQADSVGGSTIVIAVLLLVLLWILVILRSEKPSSIPDMVITYGTFGLYLGWVTVATTSNIAAFLASTDLEEFIEQTWVAIIILGIVAAAGISLALYSRGRIAPALAISWGLAWVAVGRTEGEFESQPLVWTAAIAAAMVLVSTIAIRANAERETAQA